MRKSVIFTAVLAILIALPAFAYHVGISLPSKTTLYCWHLNGKIEQLGTVNTYEDTIRFALNKWVMHHAQIVDKCDLFYAKTQDGSVWILNGIEHYRRPFSVSNRDTSIVLTWLAYGTGKDTADRYVGQFKTERSFFLYMCRRTQRIYNLKQVLLNRGQIFLASGLQIPKELLRLLDMSTPCYKQEADLADFQKLLRIFYYYKRIKSNILGL